MLEEDYCSFEVAKLLKEKGFDEPCIRHWDCDDHSLYGYNDIPISNSELQANEYNGFSAPSQSMAMKWLREEHNIFIQISAVLQDQPFGLHYRPSIQDYHAYARYDNFNEYVTYEEAVEAAIKYSLKNLI